MGSGHITRQALFAPRPKCQQDPYHHPVILIPGIVSTGLEVWSTSPATAVKNLKTDSPSTSDADEKAKAHLQASNRICGQKFFRKRMWGTVDNIRAFLMNRACWTRHMKLDEETGLDPPGVKLRAAQGLDAADYLFPGYWVWARIIANLASIGYDSNSMHLAAYDWRLSFRHLETRDLYFTKLRSTIELSYKHARVLAGSAVDEEVGKAVIISHSMGSSVFLHFLGWIRKEAGEAWCEKYLKGNVALNTNKGWINVAGTLLGVPKTLPAMLSGEMRDTTKMPSLVDTVFSKPERSALFRSWGGLASLIPKGGEAIWGTVEQAPDQPNGGALVRVASDVSSGNITSVTADVIDDFVTEQADTPYWATHYRNRLATTKQELKHALHSEEDWANPLRTALPKFSKPTKFTIWCVYGTHLPTERGYYYLTDKAASEEDGFGPTNLMINTSHSVPEKRIENGVQLTDGDATVPLLSLGYMCTEGWSHKRYNPSKIPVITREVLGKEPKLNGTGSGQGLLGFEFGFGLPSLETLRGSGKSGDHVDILGNYDLIETILRAVSKSETSEAAEKAEEMLNTNRIFSDIVEVSKKIKLPEGLD
ncbi:Lecithin:cholesterol acyltransferase-domain-containing protein [Gaertneriomyces semiglobifer]|nr:Lecithin:cholesterol acyltransferase-domain-containing protein [Gaertneriomyces semiglobifer]